MTNSKDMAYLAFGNPGFLDFIAQGFKSVAPALSFGASFIPGVGPLISKGIDIVSGAIGDPEQDEPHSDDGDED